jgi:large subunit ribosomal protein L15
VGLVCGHARTTAQITRLPDYSMTNRQKDINVPTNLSTLRPPQGATAKRKRVGRGMGSGMGKTSTRGHKGQGSRSGSRLLRGFEGGQMPLHRRLPKRGFTNIFRTEYTIISLERLADLGEATITQELLVKEGLAGKNDLIKILGDGDLKSAITVQGHRFSKSAREKIEKAGGKAELLAGAPEPPKVKPRPEPEAKPEPKAKREARAEAKAEPEPKQDKKKPKK